MLDVSMSHELTRVSQRTQTLNTFLLLKYTYQVRSTCDFLFYQSKKKKKKRRGLNYPINSYNMPARSVNITITYKENVWLVL